MSGILFASKYELIVYLVYAFKIIFHQIVFLVWFEGFFFGGNAKFLWSFFPCEMISVSNN